jgi:hypothetical protein
VSPTVSVTVRNWLEYHAPMLELTQFVMTGVTALLQGLISSAEIMSGLDA